MNARAHSRLLRSMVRLAALVVSVAAVSARAQIYDAPGTLNVNEDTQVTFYFKVAAWAGVYRHVSVTSGNQALIPNGNISWTQTRNYYEFPSQRTEWRVTFTPAPNAVGTVTLNINANDGAAIHNNATVTVNIAQVEDPPVISGLPASGTVPEDGTYTVEFDVSDLEDIAGTTVTAVSGNTSILPASGLSVSRISTGPSPNRFRLTAQPGVNQTGTVDIHVTAAQGGDSVTRTLRLFVSPVNDPPILYLSNQTVSEDAILNAIITVIDVDSPISQVVLTAVSDNQSLVPNSRIGLSGFTEIRSIVAVPMPHQYGTARITVTATDNLNASVTNSFVLTVTSENDRPIAGSPTALHLDGSFNEAVATGIGLPPGNTPHSIEAWVHPDVHGPGRRWILHLGANGNGHHWLLHPDGKLQVGAWNSSSQLTLPGLLPVGRWSHLATTWDGTNYVLYVNGIMAGQVQNGQPFDMSVPDLSLGTRIIGTDRAFDGLLDEVRVWNRALSEVEVRERMNIPLRGSEDGLLLYLPFDEGGGVTAYDYAAAGGRSHATLRPGTTYANRHEAAGLILDGVDDRVSIPHHDVFNSFPMTVVAWVRTTDTDGAIVSKYADGSLNGWTLRIVDGRLRAWYFASGSRYVHDSPLGIDGGVINDGQWHQVAFVVDNSGGRLFVDGAQVTSRPWTGAPGATTTTEAVQIGCYHNRFTDPAALLNGEIDDVSYWSSALTPAEIQRLWQGLYSGTADLMAYYPFDEADGDTAVDFANIAGGLNNGQLIGGIVRGPASTAAPFGAYVVNEETPSPIYLQGFDIENMLGQAGGSLTYTIVTPPLHGTLTRGALTLTAGSQGAWADLSQNPVTYTPNEAYNGWDRFMYSITDGLGGVSYVATVPIFVQEGNDLPTISAISDRVIEQETSTGPIPFTIADEETPASLLKVTAFSSDARLVPPSSILLGGSGSNRTIEIRPPPDEIGTATITLMVTDTAVPAGSATLEFKVRVDPKPAYALVDLGALGLLNQSYALDINDIGWVVGVAQSQPSDGHLLLNRGLTGTGVPQDLDPTRLGTAFSINDTNAITGFIRQTPSSFRQAFVWSNGELTSLAERLSGADSIGYDINRVGDVVGSIVVGSSRRAFFLPVLGGMTNLGVLPGYDFVSEALGVDSLGRVVGYSQAIDGRSRPFLWNGTTLMNLGVLPAQNPAHTDARATAINDGGLVVGYSAPNTLVNSPRRAFVYEAGTMRSLGVLPGGNYSEAWDINSFGQVVGRADVGTSPRAFLYTAGAMRDLNELIHDTRVVESGQIRDFVFATSGWELQEARGINTAGAVVGHGVRAGNPRAFLALPAWVIGRQIARPENAVERMPEIEILYGDTTDTPQNSFYWSDYEKKLYAIRPVAARLKWFTSFQDYTGSGTNIQVITDRVVVEGIGVWPKDPVIHVAGAPVEIEPRGVPFDYGYQRIIYQAGGGTAHVDPTSKTFNASAPGYSVIHYLATLGGQPNPASQRPYFEVVRTVRWNDPAHLRHRDALVGETLADPPSGNDPGHQDYLGKTGYVFFEKSRHDGVGPDRAYDRATRTGSIIPVNLDTEAEDDDMVVVWYRLSRIGVAWPSVPVRYRVSWPGDDVVDRIVIASGLGSGPLPENYGNAHAYHQPNPGLAGYNPNEEHAFVAPANGGRGQALFALRYDLNARLPQPASEPYALLKYQDTDDGFWKIRVYKVVGEEAPWFFRYSGVAGTEIAPPYPLSILPLCEESRGVAGPWWEDWRGTLYARAAGAYGEPAEIRIQWFYPLQPGFFYDLNLDGEPDAAPGAAIAWLDRREAGTLSAPNNLAGRPGVPFQASYQITWPDAPVLQIGETLLTAKNGLPAVGSMAALQLVYDDLSPAWNPLVSSNPAPVETLARLYDPLSPRVYRLERGGGEEEEETDQGGGGEQVVKEEIPAEIRRSSRGGKEYFDDLPPSLEKRLVYDPINRWLEFRGVLDEDVSGEPLLLPNVLSSRERDAIKALAPGNAQWAAIVDKLYELTRNPNRVDLAPADGAPDASTDPFDPVTNALPGLRIGLTTIDGVVVPEPLGDIPKALTAAIGGLPPPTNRPLSALAFNGTTSWLDAGSVPFNGQSFTIEFWVRRDSTDDEDYLAGMGTTEPDGQLVIGFDALGRFVFRFGEEDDLGVVTTSTYADTDWHHWAVTFDVATLRQTIYRDGIQVAQGTAAAAFTGTSSLLIGRRAAASPAGENEFFHGALDEIRVWNHARSGAVIARDRVKSLTGHEDGLLRYYRCDRLEGELHADDSPLAVHASPNGGVAMVESDAPTGQPPRYMVLAENNDPSLAGLPIRLHIIRVDDGPFAGDLKVLYPGNIFDQRLTMRHSSEFGGDPDQVEFEWYYKPDDAGIDPTDLPRVNPDGTISDLRGWIPYTSITPASGQGVNDITIGEGGESGLLTLSDNWFICRIRGYNVHGQTPWSGWVGDPSGGATPRAQLAEGWIKRVIRGLNAFDARTDDFHSNPTATYASMILQAGPRYEGDIAFNPSGENLNSLGLIEAYTTVLNRGKSLSIEGTPAVSFNPANNALLLAASRIADLYMLLGNEAYADAQDPTIGFTTSQAPYHALASSIFAFQNQLDSLLEEELALLRGRDDTHAGVAAPPVYNRLFWNFTLGEGEVAYQQNYNISDQNIDGFIDERDARILYPQGHGDAWGHYLTAIKTYYDLLRHPQFTWIPRTERVLVNGVPVEVDYLDERKFARAAAARAKTGSEVVDLTYRASYVDDPEGQWQGYKDTDPDRAWGVAEWAWRVGQGAYFDWLTGNTILPAVDPNTNHVGIQKIDRTTVSDLDEIIAEYNRVQAIIDQADAGLNPLGLVKGAMVFDIDPTFLAVGSTAAIGRQAVQGLAHFEQLNERALKALKNAMRIWDEANAQSRSLRENQDSVDAFTANVIAEERNYRNRLIEIFGYPYAGDIGPGKTYPSGYSGPDLYHYMYVPVTEITGETYPASTNFVAFFKAVDAGLAGYSHFPSESRSYFKDYSHDATDPEYLPITYPQADGPWAFSTPPDWGQRRAPGKVQEAISDVLQATARLKFVGQNYDGIIWDLNDRLALLKARFDVNAEKIGILHKQLGVTIGMNAMLGTLNGVETELRRAATVIRDIKEETLEGMPKVIGLSSDVTAPLRLILAATSLSWYSTFETVADGLAIAKNAIELSKETVGLTTEIETTIADQRYEVLQQVKELEILVRNEINLRLEVFEQQEKLRQAYGRYLAVLAEGERVLEELIAFRKRTAAQTTEYRYRDMAFRIFRNEALQKYRSTFDLAARYVYLSATAYDYESNFLGSDRRAASRFFDQIIRQRQLGVLIDGEPIPGDSGLADIQGRMIQNWEVLEPQFGLNNPQLETGRFSLRSELFRLRDADPDRLDDPTDRSWREVLRRSVVPNLWQVPEFKRYCRPFSPDSGQAEPALVLRFPTTIQFGQNYFGRPLSGGDSAFDPSYFSTKINAVGITFRGYDDSGLSRTPRVYLIPVGMDVLRAPAGNTLATREWRVLDQAVPVPFAIGANDYSNPSWIPSIDSLTENYGQPRRFAALRAFSDNGDYEQVEMTASTRLVARSVWNTEWMLIIPGGTLLADPEEGLDRFINSVSDIRLLMMVYSFAGQ